MPRPQRPRSPLGAILQSLKSDAPQPQSSSAPQGQQQRPHHPGQPRPQGQHRPQRPHGQHHGGNRPHMHRGPANTDAVLPNAPHVAHGDRPAHPHRPAGQPQRTSRPSYQYPEHKRRGKAPVQQERTQRPSNQNKKKGQVIPPPEEGVYRIIPLGGVEEVGKNMTAIETKDDIIVIDAGMQFASDDTPGIDYIIPNTTYLEERKDKIRAMFITHGHLDHIGGVPLVLSRIGNPPVYSRNLSVLMMKKRQSEFQHLPALNAIVVEKDTVITVGKMRVKFFGVTHTIPDSMGIMIETPNGYIVTPGDYKLDQIDGIVTPEEEKEYSIFDKTKTLLLMTDSTNVENEGFALPEIKVHQGLENIIKRTSGRIIIAAFASHITRLIKIIQIAEDLNKKVILNGRSMKTNMEISMEAGLLKPKKDTIIPIEDIDKYPPDRIIMLTTGGQGEEFSGLNRAANKTDKKFSLKKGDYVILSASIVPGNETQVAKMKDSLARLGVNITTYRTSGEDYVHATGHGNREDIKWLHRKINEKFFIPIHGSHYMLQSHKRLAVNEVGIPESNVIVPDNGSIIEISADGEKMTLRKEKAASGLMMVDGFTVGDEQEVVIRDRQMLAQDGMFVIVATIDQKTGKLKKSPDIISRGFVYLKESQDILHEARGIVKRTIEDGSHGLVPANFELLRGTLGDNLSKFLFQKTAKRPLVIPVLLAV